MSFEHTVNCLCFGHVRLPEPEYHFSSFFVRSYFFFLLRLFTFKPQNVLYSKFEQLKISGRTFVRLKSGVQGENNQQKLGVLQWEVPPKQALQNSNFLTFKAEHMNCCSKVNIREKENLTKF